MDNETFPLRLDGFVHINDPLDIDTLSDMYIDSPKVGYTVISSSSPALLEDASARLHKEADVVVQGVLEIFPGTVADDIITTTSLKGIHIDFHNYNEEDLKSIGDLAIKCKAVNLLVYISNMSWKTFTKLLDDYQAQATFVYIIPSDNIEDTLKSIQDRLSADSQQIKAGQLPPIFTVMGMYDLHHNTTTVKWLAQNIPSMLETMGVGSIEPIELSSTTRELFILERHDTALGVDTSILGTQYLTYLLRQFIKMANWISD